MFEEIKRHLHINVWTEVTNAFKAIWNDITSIKARLDALEGKKPAAKPKDADQK